MDSNTKHRILFVCHGNICRSPMAEFVMKDLVKKVGLEDSFMIDSAATSTEEIGNSVYPPARKKLAEHGIGCAGKTARQMTRSDYDRYDLLIGMDSWNIRNMRNICGGDPDEHLRWRPRWKNSDADGLHPSARRCGRPLVHGQLRGHLARRIRRMSGIVRQICKIK